jgi:hypothetical protein
MAGGAGNAVRVATSALLFQRVSGGISDWLDKRRKADSRGQHTTQLTAIGAVLGRILAQLEQEQKGLTNSDVGALYEACHRFDRRTVWLERLWRFFQSRFDQREDPERAAVLGVADELVWSLYSGPVQKATLLGLRSGPSPAPVAFIEAQYSPEAYPTEVVPPDLKDEGEATSLLKEHLNKMPAPVVRMAPACVAAPWLVVYLAHEVGHHLQYDLLPQRKLVTEFRQVVETAVEQNTGSSSEAKLWGGWSKEIFADLFSVMAVGKAAVWAMGEMEFTAAKGLDEERTGYPPPGTRLALLAEACDRVTGTASGTAALSGLFTPPQSAVRQAVLDAALGPLPGLGTSLAKFCTVSVPAFEQEVAVWQDVFKNQGARDPAPHIANAPVLTGAAVGQWQAIAATTAREKLTAACGALESQYVTKVAAGAPDDGPRGSEEEPDVETLAGDILDRIWQETR